MVDERVGSVSQLYPSWCVSRTVRVWMKAFIMTAGPFTVQFRWEQQLLGVAAH